MSYNTLTYNEEAKGWTSFHSYDPEWIVNLNDSYFTFKDGQLYIHDLIEDDRNEFYGDEVDSIIEYVANEGPSDVKMYRALKLEGDTAWEVEINTEEEEGFINKDSFQNKEQMRYAYVRNKNTEVDFKKLSVQGLGLCSAFSTTDNTVTITDLNVGLLSVGDILYKATPTDGELSETVAMGAVQSIEGDVITYEREATPAVDDFILFAKNQTAESEGVRGYHAKVKLTSDSTDPIELYAVDAEVTKSNL